MAKGSRFDRFTEVTIRGAGSSRAFVTFAVAVLIWLALGRPMSWSNAWQLLINTPTTVVTTALGFLILYSTRKDSAAIHAKLDLLVKAACEDSDDLQRLEEETPEEIERVRKAHDD